MDAREPTSIPGDTASERPQQTLKKRVIIQYPVHSRRRGRNRRYNIVSRAGYFNENKRANCDFTPPGLTWLFIQTQTTTLLPTNQSRRLSTPRKWTSNLLLGCLGQEKGGPGASQSALCLAPLKGGRRQPMGSLSAATRRERSTNRKPF